MKTEIFKGRRTIDMKSDDDFKKSIVLTISMERVIEDLKQFNDFKGTPTNVATFIDKKSWGYSCMLLVNNKSRTYKDMEYIIYLSNEEIFEYIINELKDDIRNTGYSSGYTI
jgi:hypothetical protein